MSHEDIKTVAQAIEYVKGAGCPDCRGDGAVPFDERDITEVLFYKYNCPDGWDSDSCGLFKLKDGRIGYVAEWSDSSGHG
ncbi:MAG: hypothetical protein ACYS5V_11515 [Planctomycetota bacterium]|jgi:hypothetical protein